MEQIDVHIEYMPLSQLKRANRNPKDHDLGTIHESIRRFGFTQPLLLNEATSKLVAGHGRLDALQQMKALGETVPERIITKGKEWLVPVVRGIFFANEEEAEAYLLADNRIVEIGGWDEKILVQSLSDLAAKGEEMLRGIGWTVDEVDDLIRKSGLILGDKDEITTDNEDDETIPEETPEQLMLKYDVHPGDLWQIGNHYLLVDDCRDARSWQRLMVAAGVSEVNGLFTSPPYAEQRAKRSDWYGGVPENEYVAWWEAVQENAARYMASDASFFLNIKPNVVNGARVLYVFDLVLAMCRQWDWFFIDEFCWERIGNPGIWKNRFKNGFEPVYHFSKTTEIKFNPYSVSIDSQGHQDAVPTNVNTGDYYNRNRKDMDWSEALPSNRLPFHHNAEGHGHPAAFPLKLPEFFIKAFSDDQDVWIDPFAGSGTTGVACDNHGRTCLMMEVDPRYAAITLERMMLSTGQAPARVKEAEKENASWPSNTNEKLKSQKQVKNPLSKQKKTSLKKEKEIPVEARAEPM